MKTQVTKYDKNVNLYYVLGDCNLWAFISVISLSPGKGILNIVSDYGNYSYNWGCTGYDLLEDFLIKISHDYLMDKLTYEKRDYVKYLNFEKTIKEMKRRVIESRKHGEIDKVQAREAWDTIILHIEDDIYTNNPNEFLYHINDNILSDNAFWDVFGEMAFLDVYTEYHPQLKMFVEKIWVPFIDYLKEERKDGDN